MKYFILTILLFCISPLTQAGPKQDQALAIVNAIFDRSDTNMDFANRHIAASMGAYQGWLIDQDGNPIDTSVLTPEQRAGRFVFVIKKQFRINRKQIAERLAREAGDVATDLAVKSAGDAVDADS